MKTAFDRARTTFQPSVRAGRRFLYLAILFSISLIVSRSEPSYAGTTSVISAALLDTCGDGTIQAPENCDEGSANGTATSCCSATCTFRPSTDVCRASAGECDPAEMCTGGSGRCPNNAKSPNGTPCTDDGKICTDDLCNGAANACQHPAGHAGLECRASAGECDPAEMCDGTNTLCPSNAKSPNGTPCTDDGKICTLDQCNGAANGCQHPAGHTGTECRPSAGECDPAEACDGLDTACPSDAKSPDGTPCTEDSRLCSLDQCNGTSDDCKHPAGHAGLECRASAGECDPAETCDGLSILCPSNAKSPDGTPCTEDGLICTLDQCNGAANACQHPAGHAGTECRPSAGECDPAETCDGLDTACPSNAKSPDGTLCTEDGNPCTLDQCNGTNVDCRHPAGNAGTECRASGGECDIAEVCDGSHAACPSNAKQPDGTPCTDDGKACSLDQCNGTNNACQHPPQEAGTPCRDAANECDAEEVCDGVSLACPNDQKLPQGTPCTPDARICTRDECDGTSNACKHPAGNAGVECRALEGPCDVAEVCDGLDTQCPSDAKAPAATSCPDDGKPCTVDQCDGTLNACQHTAGNAGVECRAAAGDCDQAEVCSGSGENCPPDDFLPNGTVCDDSSLCSQTDICLSGTCTGINPVICPADACHEPGVCEPTTGECSDPGQAPDGTVCNDSDARTFEATKDAWIQEDQPTDNFGADAVNDVKSNAAAERSALIQFDLSSIPSCGTVVGATLIMHINTNTQPAGVDRTHAVHRLNTSWAEGTGAAGSGVTWDTSDGTTSWTAGGNFAATATATATAPGGTGTFVSWDVTTDVSAFLAGTAVNNGWLVKDHNVGTAPATRIGYASRTNPVAANRPRLVVTFIKCGDGSACTLTDTCLAGTCQGGNEVACTASDQCHAAGTCDPASGACSNPSSPDDQPCDDEDACTKGEACQSGACTGGMVTVCTAIDECHTAGECDAGTGACTNPTAANGTPCGDAASDCVRQDMCSGGVCLDSGFQPDGTPCGSQTETICDRADTCNDQGTCLPNYESTSTTCRPSQAECDPAEYCTGSSASCPSDVVSGSAAVGNTLKVTKTGSTATISWADPQPALYNVYRGSRRTGLPWAYNQGCLSEKQPEMSTDDPDPVTLGTTFYYLVTRTQPLCGESSLGANSSGQERPNEHPCPSPGGDADGDLILDQYDNCPSPAPGSVNPTQEDADLDALGDVCDNCPLVGNPGQEDLDHDSMGDSCDPDIDNDQIPNKFSATSQNCTGGNNAGCDDNCPTIANFDQGDGDADGVGNACDNCRLIINPDQSDTDSDRVGNACDNCPEDFNPGQADTDGDGLGDVCDPMPLVSRHQHGASIRNH